MVIGCVMISVKLALDPGYDECDDLKDHPGVRDTTMQ